MPDGSEIDGECVAGKKSDPDYGETWRLFWDWALERGAGRRFCDVRDKETGEMARSRGAQQMRDEYKKGRCRSSYDPTKLFPGGYGTADAYVETMADSNWTGNNLTQTQVGGFVDRFDNPGNSLVMYSIYNQASMRSFFLHSVGVPHKRRGSGFPFLGNLDQYFRWVEQNPLGCP